MLAVGNKMPTWVSSGFEEYQKRFPRDMSLDLVEITPQKRGKKAELGKIKSQEGEALLAAVPKGHRIVTLEVHGRPWTTPQLAQQMAGWQMNSNVIKLFD